MAKTTFRVLGLLGLTLATPAWAKALPKSGQACKAAKPAWFFHNANHKRVIEHKEEHQGELAVHEWFVAPAGTNSGNQLQLIYREDPKLPRLKSIEPFLDKGLEKLGGLYFRCTSAPERHLFAGGFYYTRVVVSNYQDCATDCELRVVVPYDPTKTEVTPAGDSSVDSQLKNPNLKAALAIVAGADKAGGADVLPPVPEKRQAAQSVSRSFEIRSTFKPPRGESLGRFTSLKDMPSDVLKRQTRPEGQ